MYQVNTNEALIYALTGYMMEPKKPNQVPPGDISDAVGEHDETDFQEAGFDDDDEYDDEDENDNDD
jgi:hypothetical protein